MAKGKRKRIQWVRLIKSLSVVAVLCITICVVFISPGQAFELSGYAAAEGRLFFNDAPYHGQEENSASLALQPEQLQRTVHDECDSRDIPRVLQDGDEHEHHDPHHKAG